MTARETRDTAVGIVAERADPELAAAVSEYLRLTHGDVGQALAVAVADGLAVSRLVSTGFARLRQPHGRPRQGRGFRPLGLLRRDG